MEIKDVKKEKKKDFICSVRVSKEQSEFMKKEDLRPGTILRKALDELMKEEKWKE